jgi:hypothetical protein
MRRIVQQSPRPRAVLAAATAATVVATSAALTLSGPAAAQDEQFAIRAIGITKLETKKPVLNRMTVNCVTPGTNGFVDCVPAGTAVVTVDAATKRKLKLTSAIIAKGDIVARTAGGEGEDGGTMDVKATSAVRKKLAKASSVTLTYKLTTTAPVNAVMKATQVWKVNTTAGIKRLLLRSPGDTFVISTRG